MSQDIYVVVEHLRGHVADITYVMLAAARVLAEGTGGRVVAVLLGHDAQSLARDLAADEVICFDHAALADFSGDAYQKVLLGLIADRKPRVVLFGHTSVGMDVAGSLSARLKLPMIGQCHTFQVEGGVLKFVSQICGGKIMAEGEVPGPTALATLVPGGYRPEQGRSEKAPAMTLAEVPTLADVRVTLKQYVEPEAGDVDISKEPILVAVGRGIQNKDNVELAQELAEALGGVMCASRPVVDQGWLPVTRQVGKSGKSVNPKVYLALGISGAPEHVEGITGSEMIIAVNTDATAPIFGVAQYGSTIDLLDLVPVLTEKIRQAREG